MTRRQAALGIALISTCLGSGVPAFSQTPADAMPRYGFPRLPTCVDDPRGLIDFEGTLGRADGGSSVQILRDSDAAEFYVSTYEIRYGTATAPPVQTTDALQQLEQRITQLPAVLALAHTAGLVAGNFKCIGFAPGRYIFFAQIHGSGVRPADPPGGITFYRADIDVSTLRSHSVVVIRGFRRIGSFPAGT